MCYPTLVNVLLGFLLGDWDNTVLLGSRWVSSVRCPNGVLQQLVGVLLLNHHSESLEDISSVVNQDSTLGREFLNVNRGVFNGVGKSLVHLLVVWHSSEILVRLSPWFRADSPIVESLDDTPKLHLSLHILFELCARCGDGDRMRGRVGAELRLGRSSVRHGGRGGIDVVMLFN